MIATFRCDRASHARRLGTDLRVICSRDGGPSRSRQIELTKRLNNAKGRFSMLEALPTRGYLSAAAVRGMRCNCVP